MTFTIKIDTENDALAGLNREYEVRRILANWMKRDIMSDRKLLDVNGNTVGSVTVKGK